MNISFSKTLLGLGLASSLYLGCQQFTGEGSTGVSDDASADSDGSLALKVRSVEECLALQTQILTADSAGILRTQFAKHCVEEIKPGPGPVAPIPPELIPDSATSCEWLIAKFDTLDTASKEYPRLKHSLHHLCGIIDPNHPKPDTLPSPPPPRLLTLCDSIHMALAGLDRTSDEYAALKSKHDEVCHIPPPPKDSLLPPPLKDSLPPPPPHEPTLCDTLHHAMAGLDRTSDEYAALKSKHDEVCHIPPPPKDSLLLPPPKDSLP